MKNVVQFLSEVRLELSRVVWPKMDDWIGSTTVVLILMTIFAIYLGLVDKGLDMLMRQIFKIYS